MREKTTPGAKTIFVYYVHWSPDGKPVAAGGYYYPPVVRRAWQSTEDLIAHARECCASSSGCRSSDLPV